METTLTYEGKELIVKPRVNETFAVLNNINVNNLRAAYHKYNDEVTKYNPGKILPVFIFFKEKSIYRFFI